MVDWDMAGVIIAAAVPTLGAVVGYGILQQRVKGMERETGEKFTAHDKRLEKVETAVDGIHDVKSAVELLRKSTEGSHELLLSKQQASADLLTEKFTQVAGEVRSFMQGQASAGARRPGGVAPRKS